MHEKNTRMEQAYDNILFWQSSKKRTLQRIFEKHVDIMSDTESVRKRMKTDNKFAYVALYKGKHSALGKHTSKSRRYMQPHEQYQIIQVA